MLDNDVVNHLDTVVIIKGPEDEFEFLLEKISNHRRQEAILVIQDKDLENFKVQLTSFGKNSFFYLLVTNNESTSISWYKILTLTDYSHFIMNEIIFDEYGRVVESYDLKGLEIIATSLDWLPFIAHENCNNIGRKCSNYGLLADQMNIWAKMFNFTWDIMAGYDGDWGLFPKSGMTKL